MSETTTLRGLAALNAMFKRTQSEGRAAFLPYYPIGFPDYDASIDAIVAMAESGVDGFEIGVPFSDPLADGPVIQAATQQALANGVTVRKCLDVVKTLRGRGLDQPMLLMSYANPLVAYGVDAFIADAVSAGVDGLIIPDMPPDEAGVFSAKCAEAGMALVFMIAPTSSESRIKLVAEHATGMIYVVSLVGVTGARSELPDYLTEFIARIRQYTTTPLTIGFGISKPEQARQMNELVDGFIVGSAMVRAGQDGTAAVRQLAQSLRQALD